MLAVLHSVESAVTHEIQEARRRGETAQRSLADRGAITHHPPSPNTRPHTHTRPRRCSVGPQLSNPAPSHGLPCSAAHRFSSPASSTASISAGAVAPPLVSGFPIAFVLFWCSWLLRGHGAGGEVEGGKVKPCSPANLASCDGGAGYQHQPTQSSEQVVQEEVKTLLCR